MRFRTPASVELRRAQALLVLAALVPTSLATVVAIMVLVFARSGTQIVLGILVLVFGLLAITGAVFVQIFLRRGDSMARLQHDFVSTVSHELRTPLTSIRLFTETLAMGRVTDPAEAKRVNELLAKEVARLESLVERVLDLARLEAGKRDFAREPTPVEAVIDGALAAFEAQRLAAQAAPMPIDCQVEPNLIVDVDRAALEQALLNLLWNAHKYSGEKRSVTVRAAREGRRVAVSVSDNGPGISRADQRIIFEPFERGEGPARSEAQGTGMGLAVVNLIVRAHRGKVEVSSQPGAGATFRLLLPRSHAGPAGAR